MNKINIDEIYFLNFKKRKLDVFFETEEKLMGKQTLVSRNLFNFFQVLYLSNFNILLKEKSIMEIINDPESKKDLIELYSMITKYLFFL